MKKNHLIFAAAACMLAASCQTQELNAPANAIDFRADFGHYYSVKATDTSFEEEDAVSIFAGAPINSGNVKYTLENGKFTSQNPICWLDGQTQSTYFSLIYPYNPSLSDTDEKIEFTVNADQSTHALYTASDLIIGDAKASPSDKSVVFNVNHFLSKVMIRIHNYTDKTISEVYLSGVYGKYVLPEECVAGSKGTIKACPVRSGGINTWVLIIPPQTSQPELMVTTTDGEQITYNLHSEVTFHSGCQSNAEVSLSEGNIFTGFTTEISDWAPDSELQFSNDDTEEWESLGTGKFLDEIIADLFGLPPYEMDVEYFRSANHPEKYMIKDPYKSHPYARSLGYQDGGAIHFTVRQDGIAYITESETGLSYATLGKIYCFSCCPEYGDDKNCYFYKFYEGCLQTDTSAPYVFVTFENSSNAYYTNYDAMTVFTFPGYVRQPVFYNFKPHPDGFFNAKSQTISFSKGFDLTRIGAAVLPGSISVTRAMINDVIAGTLEGQVYFNGNETEYYIENVPTGITSTGVYTAILAGDCDYADGYNYYGYYTKVIPYIAPGDTAPACKPEILSAGPDDSDPSSVLSMTVKVDDVLNCYYLALPKAEFEALQLEESGYVDYVYSFGQYASGTLDAFQGNGQKVQIGGLTPSTEYVILVAASNLFEQKGWAKATAATGGELQFKSIGTGKFYDNIIGYMFLEPGEQDYVEYSTDVEILQEVSGKPIYRVLNPYKALMDSKPELTSRAKYGPEPSEMISLFTHQYSTGNYVFYEPFYIGLNHYEDILGDGIMEYPLYYEHGSGDIFDEPERYSATYMNKEIAPGVFQLAPKLTIGNSGYYYDWRGESEAVVIVLPGATYPVLEPEAKAASTQNVHKAGMKPVKQDLSALSECR